MDWMSNGERAEEVLRAESLDAAVIDIGLPGMDGLDQTAALAREVANPALPMLILTTHALH